MKAVFYFKGPGSQGSYDPLNQKATLGVKLLGSGRQYGVVLGSETLRRLGIVIPDEVTFSVEAEQLVEGVPPKEI